MKRALLGLLAAVAVGISLASPAQAASPNSTPPEPSPPKYASVSSVIHYTTGKAVGPNSYTDYGKWIIDGYSNSGGKYHRIMHTMEHVPPTTIGADATRPGVVAPDSWYNPTTWDWGHIIGSTWNGIWNNCLKGSLSGIVGTAGGALLTNLIARGAVVYLGPWGYAALAFNGCIVEAVG